MAKEKEKRIRDAFATWLRTSSELVTLATAASNIRAENQNAPAPVPGVVFSMNTQPFVDGSDQVFLSYVLISCMHANKALMLDMLGAISDLARPAGNQRDASFTGTNVATMGIAWLGSDESFIGSTSGARLPEVPLENVFRGEATIRLVWRDTAS